MVDTEGFSNTVTFQLRDHLSAAARQETLDAIKGNPYVEDVVLMDPPSDIGDTYNVVMKDENDHVLVGKIVANHDGVYSTSITPASHHALKAKLAM